MVAVFGEKCTGKYELACALRDAIPMQLYAADCWLREGEAEAADRLRRLLLDRLSRAPHIVYVLRTRGELDLIPPGAVRIRLTRDLERMKQILCGRMFGDENPGAMRALEAEHGLYGGDACDLSIHELDGDSIRGAVDWVRRRLGRQEA